MTDEHTFSKTAGDLIQAVDAALPKLRAISERDAEKPRAAGVPEKWSPKQVIGHLIDSAANNHQRFVRAQFKDDLVFDGYEQDAWVSLQRYRESPWAELIDLWRLFNLHIARIMQAAPNDERVRKRARHNLDEIAWQSVSRDEPATLDFFMNDYVGHLKHHLAQVGVLGR